MRLIVALAATGALVQAGSAYAETWKAYSALTPNNIQWSYDNDYTYRDQASGRLVVLTAAGKVGADPRVGPSAPGAADGAGAVVAVDCKKRDTVFLSGFSPKKPLDIPSDWRKSKGKAAGSDADAAALIDAVCATADSYPVK